MTAAELEKRVLRLEMEMARLKDYVARKEKAGLPWWKKIRGTFADDEAHEEAMRLGREYRMAQRPLTEDEKE